MSKEKIKSFTDLDVWQEGHKLVLMIYKIVNGFPDKERFVLIPQLLRSVISVTSNIAEGFGKVSFKEKIYFYNISRGSLSELLNQLLIARDLKYIKMEVFEKISEQIVSVHMLLNGSIRFLKKK